MPNIRLIPTKVTIKGNQLWSKVKEIIAESRKEPSELSLSEHELLLDDRKFVVYDEDIHEPVGLYGWGGPTNEVYPFFHTTPRYQGKCYGKRAVELLAEEMHRKGVTTIKEVPILSEASRNLACHLRKCFNKIREV